jgi:hypothetical protein
MPDNIYGDLVNPEIVGTPTAEEQLAAQQELERVKAQAMAESAALQPQQPSKEVKQEQPTQVESTDSQQTESGTKPVQTPGYRDEQGKIDWDKLEKHGSEFDNAALYGLGDTAIGLLNFFLPKEKEVPKLTKYENEAAQTIRDITGFIIPTMLFQGAGMAAGTALNSRIGLALGQSKFVQFMGARGVEAGTAALIGKVTDTNEEGDNLLGMAKKTLPPQWDFIPDSMATLDSDSPDMKKQKSINEDIALGFLIPTVGALSKFVNATTAARAATKGQKLKAPLQPSIVPETPQAKAWVDANAPEDAIRAQARHIYDNRTLEDGTLIHRAELQNDFNNLSPQQQEDLIKTYTEAGEITTDPNLMELAKYEINQTDALNELGYYNNMMNPDNTEVALRGVHDLFDWNETAMRSVDDFGIVGASIDAARIAKNAGTVNGRIGNMVSLPAIKYGSVNVGATEDIVTGLSRQLKSADRFSVTGNTWSLSADEIDNAGNMLIREMFEPTIDAQTIQSILEPVQIKVGDQVVTFDNGYSSMFRDTEGLSNVDLAKTQAYLQTSMAGQISDLSEAIRINGNSASTQFAQEKLRDRLMFMFKQDGLNKYYSNSKRSVIQSLKNGETEVARNLANAMELSTDPELRRIQQEAIEFGENLKWFEENEPEMLEVFQELYELSDGRIKNINDINTNIRNSFTNWNMLWKKDPEGAKNILAGALRANHQNSMLSSAETGGAALLGNLTGIVNQPVSYFAGAVSRGDLKQIQRGWMAYSAVLDTTKKALPYAAKMFWKASTNPKAITSQTRLDLIVKKEEMLEQYKKIAQIQAEKGNYGLKYLIEQYEMWQGLAEDPVFRFIPNTFTGFDGFARSVVANGEARFRAMNAIEESGGTITRSEVKRLADIEYNSMFDDKGLINDEAVKYGADEIALNLDLGIVKGMDGVLNRMPFLRSIVMFHTSVANMAKLADDSLPYSMFQKDINQLAYRPMKDFLADPDLVDDLLSQRGYKVNTMTDLEKINTISDIKNRTRGKKAIASLLVTALTGTILEGKLTGDGLYDKETQKSRVKNSDFKPRTMEILGKRVEYEDILGPALSNWVATYANILDNFDMIGEAGVEELGRKMLFVLGGALTEKAVLGSIGPLAEMLQGNTFAVNRWAAGHLNALAPLAGARGTASKLLDSGLREVEYDLLSMIQNRNAGLIYDSANRAPYTYNPVTGAVPNNYNIIQRLWNSMSPIKIHDLQTDEERYLQDIEWDQSSTFKTKDGVDLTRDERSEGLRLMGEQGYWRTEIKRIMNSKDGKRAIQELRDARFKGIPSSIANLKYWRGIHIQLGQAQTDAEKLAYEAMEGPMRLAIQERKMEQERAKELSEYGIIERK